MQKRDKKTKRYNPYSIPKDRHSPMVADLDEIVNCTNCGKEVSYGESYTSKLIHNDNGFGYPVCHECYFKEEK